MAVMHCIYNRNGRGRLGSEQPEEDSGAEERYVYYGETKGSRLLAVVLTERKGRIRVITAYDLDAGQKRDYLKRRAVGE